MFSQTLRPLLACCALGGLLAVSAGCGPVAESISGSDGSPVVVPHYDRATGRLEQLTSDRNGDGQIDTWAYMEGQRLDRIELDRDGDGRPDRVEYYQTPPTLDPAAPLGGATIARAEEWSGADRIVTRQEWYEHGLLRRVEEDVDADGRVDRWEEHVGGRLVRMDLDLQKRGGPDRRLFYGPRGQVERVESDPDGDGVFELASSRPGNQ